MRPRIVDGVLAAVQTTIHSMCRVCVVRDTLSIGWRLLVDERGG